MAKWILTDATKKKWRTAENEQYPKRRRTKATEKAVIVPRLCKIYVIMLKLICLQQHFKNCELPLVCTYAQSSTVKTTKEELLH